MSQSAGQARSQKKFKRPRVRSADLIVLIVIGLLAVATFSVGFDQIFSWLYNPLVGTMIVIMIVEFLWLKSGDRTRLYKLENDRLRTKLRQDEELLKRAADLVQQAVTSAETETLKPLEWHAQATSLQKDITDRV